MATLISDSHMFSVAIHRAVRDYQRQLGAAQWTETQLQEMAKSAAISVGLDRESEVDGEVVAAILTFADSQSTENQQHSALRKAWLAYRRFN